MHSGDVGDVRPARGVGGADDRRDAALVAASESCEREFVGTGLLLAGGDEATVRAEVAAAVFGSPETVFVGADGQALDEPAELDGEALANVLCG